MKKRLGAENGTTYNLEIYYGNPFTGSAAFVWGTTTSTFGATSAIWADSRYTNTKLQRCNKW